MKVKLLKKIRKRFSIVHYPKGWRYGDAFFDGNYFVLWDANSGCYLRFTQLITYKTFIEGNPVFDSEKTVLII